MVMLGVWDETPYRKHVFIMTLLCRVFHLGNLKALNKW